MEEARCSQAYWQAGQDPTHIVLQIPDIHLVLWVVVIVSGDDII